MKRVLVLLAIISFYTNIMAQSKIIGKISDISDNKPMAGVSIYLPELNTGTYSNAEGNFELKKIPQGYFTVQFTFIGYESIVLQISNATQNLSLQMTPSEVKSPEVVITAGKYSSQHENAIQIMAINKEEILDDGAISLMEKLSNIPGVDMISKGNGITKPVIRGLSMTNILMLNNGIRMENYQFSANHPFVIEEYGIERIEVIKGPASLLYGSDAVGGVINVLPEKAAARNQILSDYNMQYHSNTQAYNTSAGIRGTIEDFSAGIRIGAKSHLDYTTGNAIVVPNSRLNSNNIKAQIAWNKTFGNFRFYFDQTNMKLGLTLAQSIALNPENIRKNEIWYQDLNNMLIASNNTFFMQNSKVVFNIAYMSNHRKLKGSDLTPVFTLADMKLSTFTSELKSIYTISKKFELSTGAQGFIKTNKNKEVPQMVVPNYSSIEISGFSLLQYGDEQNLNLQTGLRYDYKRIDVPEQTHLDKAIPELHKTYQNLSYSIGGTYHLAKYLLLRGNFASAYRNPNEAELTQNGIHGTRYEQGNADLISQKSYETDLSIHYHRNKMSVDIALFNNELRNYIFISPSSDSINGNVVYKYMQQNANIKGTELMVEFAPANFVHFALNYDYLYAKQADGKNLPFIPHSKFKPGITLKYKQLGKLHNLKFSISSVYAFAQNSPASYETPTAAYFLLNTGSEFSIHLKNSKLQLSIQINNLLDEAYTDHLSTLKELNYLNMGRNIVTAIKIPVNIDLKTL